MNLWFRLLAMIARRPWRRPVDPFATTVVRMRVWPTDRLSVADRGLREGLLYAQMSADGVLEDGPI